ncbi:hypothetical protein RRG08_049457 [Elysia crispata]|uniref:Uncharacterized protein n=1 Tax=Elysia crispata TaxID=231223 RepID=A0AAE0ZTA8_9GAST|nr:hypothetical protein RRG08_049457 [Elysia crispata]
MASDANIFPNRTNIDKLISRQSQAGEAVLSKVSRRESTGQNSCCPLDFRESPVPGDITPGGWSLSLVAVDAAPDSTWRFPHRFGVFRIARSSF